jgi:hypothetical protein
MPLPVAYLLNHKLCNVHHTVYCSSYITGLIKETFEFVLSQLQILLNNVGCKISVNISGCAPEAIWIRRG